ncbi:hypothetical protein MBLNU230_g3374t1 [Neophaeotheca triangularis]
MSNSAAISSRLQSHLSEVEANPSTPLDQRLLEEAEIVLSVSPLEQQEHFTVVKQLSTLLPQLQQDPTTAASLLTRLLEPFSFGDILSFDPRVDFAAGLAVGEDDGASMEPYSRLMLSLLEKATRSSADAAAVAAQPEVLRALVRLWLCTSVVGVASRSSKFLLDLLRIDQIVVTDPDAAVPEGGGQGLVSKRIFGDRDVYGTIFEACSSKGPSSFKMGKNARTLAQSRFMEWLPTVAALDWNVVTKSQHPDVEAKFAQDGSPMSLLDFAAVQMVDYEGDVLMHRCLIDFYSDLLFTTAGRGPTAAMSEKSPALAYLDARGLHNRTSMVYLQLPGTQVDPVDAMFLYGPAGNYIATYASKFSQRFTASPMLKQVKDRLSATLSLSSSRWAHQESPKHDLHVLASLPRAALLPGDSGWASSPLSLLPSKATNPDVLLTLATIFHGPEREILTFPPTSPLAGLGDDSTRKAEASAARSLYYHYLAANPRFFANIATHADTVALKDLALAAITCLAAVITANWATEPAPLPTTIATPESGHLAILAPPALEDTLPYLLKPAQSFANLVGGRGDSESAAYKIASAKYDALKAMQTRLRYQVDRTPGEGYEDILATVEKKLAEGPLNREGEVGGNVGTLEL